MSCRRPGLRRKPPDRLFPVEIKRPRPIGSAARALQQDDRPEAAGLELVHGVDNDRMYRSVQVEVAV